MINLSLKGGSVTLALLATIGCARHAVRTDGLLPASCVRADVRLVDCNFQVDPPKCRSVALVYDPKCVQIEVKK